LNGCLSILHIVADNRSFTGSQAVCLDHHLIADVAHVLFRLVWIIKDLVLRFGHTDLPEKIIGEGSVALQPAEGLLGTHGPNPPLIEDVDEPLLQGVFRSHINQVDSLLDAEVRQPAEVGQFEEFDKPSLAFGGVVYPGISRGKIDLIHMLAVRIGVSQTMIPAARTVDQYFHDALP